MASIPDNRDQKLREMAVVVDRLQGQVQALLAYVSATASMLGGEHKSAMQTYVSQRELSMLAPPNHDHPKLTANRTIDQIVSTAAAPRASQKGQG